MEKTDNNPAISLKDVSIRYTYKKEGLPVVNKVDLTIENHSFVSIIGPSGCGKSTLFHAISDLLDSHKTHLEGKLTVLNMSAEKARKKRHIGVIFQKPTLLEWRTVRANVLLPLEVMGVAKEKRDKAADKLLSLVGLHAYSPYFPNMLSGGMQQKVAIARALAYNPSVLLMDEPFAALDEISRREMNEELIKIWKETKKTILFVTHSIAEAVYLSQKIIVLSRRPAMVKKTIPVHFPYPRDRVENTERFYQYIREIRTLLKDEQ